MLCDNCEVELAPGYRDNAASVKPKLKDEHKKVLFTYIFWTSTATAVAVLINLGWMLNNSGHLEDLDRQAKQHFDDWTYALNQRQHKLDEAEKSIAAREHEEDVRDQLRKLSTEELMRRINR